eukprot:2033422-Rhodomonas_salina.2
MSDLEATNLRTQGARRRYLKQSNRTVTSCWGQPRNRSRCWPESWQAATDTKRMVGREVECVQRRSSLCHQVGGGRRWGPGKMAELR